MLSWPTLPASLRLHSFLVLAWEDLAQELEDAIAIPYTEIPHFAHSTVAGHAGRLLIGNLEEVPVVAMQGRFHLYEGYTPQMLTFPIRVMSLLGARTLIVTNAAGGVNPTYRPGDFMLIHDHIAFPGLAGGNPLIGPNDERFGVRFPPLAKAYDTQLRALAHSVAAEIPEITLHEGIYTMVAGPSFETEAETQIPAHHRYGCSGYVYVAGGGCGASHGDARAWSEPDYEPCYRD